MEYSSLNTLMEKSCLIGQAENVNVDGLIHIAKRLNCLTGENKELKEENERLCNFNLHKILDKRIKRMRS